MDSKELLLLVACLGLLGELRLTSTTTTTTFVAAMSIANQDLERYFRTTNASQTLAAMTEERIAMDMYTYAYLNYSYLNEQHKLVEIKYDEEKARYGEGRVLEPRGKLVHISDINSEGGKPTDFACSPNIQGTNGEPIPEPGIKWIALVRRGRCTFEEKVMHVHSKGAAGVIIYNDKPVTNLEKMQIKGKSRNITAVITYHDIGINMTQILDQGFDVTAAIIEGRSGMRPIHTMNRTSVLFVSISFIVLMIISLVWLVFYYIQRFRYLQTKDQQSRHLCSVTKKAIMKIPTKTGKVSDEKDADSDCCAICIEAYKPSDCIRVLPCKHEFHKNCIDPWLIEHRTCPMCKLDVLKFYGYVFIDSEESILEYEAERSVSVSPTAAAAVAQPSVAGAETQSRLADMIRSRDFVIDFPRVFVLDASNTTATQDTLFPEHMPERSQSSLTLAHAKEWMSQMSNKLEEQQHGFRRVRKNSARCELQENLLEVRCDSTKRRRSRSADGRYSNGGGGHERKTAAATRGTSDAADVELAVAADVCLTAMSHRSSRRNSSALRILTDASYAQSIQRRREELIQQARRRVSAVPLTTQPLGLRHSSVSAERSDVSVQILLNGEGIDF